MNIRQKDILNCLALLASVLGDRYGVQVRIGGSEAYTDGKVIHIPALPLDCDTTALALAKGFVDHEAGHIRHTDFLAVKAANMDVVTFNLFLYGTSRSVSLGKFITIIKDPSLQVKKGWELSRGLAVFGCKAAHDFGSL